LVCQVVTEERRKERKARKFTLLCKTKEKNQGRSERTEGGSSGCIGGIFRSIKY
jgi:hypothetical protein